MNNTISLITKTCAFAILFLIINAVVENIYGTGNQILSAVFFALSACASYWIVYERHN